MVKGNDAAGGLDGGRTLRSWWRPVLSCAILVLAIVSNAIMWFSFPGIPACLHLVGGHVVVQAVAFYAPELWATVLVVGGLPISCIAVALLTPQLYQSRRPAPDTGVAAEFGRAGCRRVRLNSMSAAEVMFCLIFSGAAVTLLWENRSGIPGWMLVAIFVQNTCGLLALVAPRIAPKERVSGGLLTALPQPRSQLEQALGVLAFAGAGASAATMLVVALALASTQPPWQRMVVLGLRPAPRGVSIVVGGTPPTTVLQGLVAPSLVDMGALAAALGVAAAACWIFCDLRDRRYGAASEDAASPSSAPCERSRVVALLLWAGAALSLAVEVVVLFDRRFYWGMKMGHSLTPIIFGQVLASALVLLARPLGVVTVCRPAAAAGVFRK